MNQSMTRRQFIRRSGISIAVITSASTLGFNLDSVQAAIPALRIKNIKPVPTICPFCGSGCGLIVYAEDGAPASGPQLISVQGDPDNPINRGAACSKGSALFNLREIYNPETGKQEINPKRVAKPLYRAPGSDKWEEKEWDWMLDRIAERIKETRDKHYEHKDKDGIIVNRCEKLASLGGAALDNEELMLITKMNRALGMTFFEHQARICHSSTVGGLAPTFGRGAMTNHFVDMKNTDCALIIGSNAAETHPITFKWLTEAKVKRGAKIINVDPRFTRTSARSDIYAPMRSGTDIAFIGGMINYILENKLYHEEYVRYYTNATLIVKEGFGFEDGLFSGYDASKRQYDKSSWKYEMTDDGQYVKDMTMEHPRCVFQILKNHYSRYDIDTICNLTGTPRNKYLQVIQAYAATGAPDKAGTILYAMGTTQHTVGVENVRSYAMLQLLLGNIGRPGGGVNALRGESNVQGSTDWALLYHIIPGYLNSPEAKKHPDLATYNAVETPKTGYWVNKPKFLASLLKSYWMNESPEKGYEYLPKRIDGKNYSHIALFEAMYKQELEGLLIWGSNPVVGGPNSNKEQAALANLKWMVAIDLWMTETSEFWTYKAVDRPTARDEYGIKKPKEIQTEVFFLPACNSYEKAGSITNSGRWMQYRWKACDPVGESKADLEIAYDLMQRVKKLYEGNKRVEDEPVTRLSWDYGHGAHPDIDKIAREINGFTVVDGKPGDQVTNFTKLMDDGSTACSNWVYSGCYPADTGKPEDYLARRRDNNDVAYPGTKPIGSYSNWSWAWPVNRRIIYNRCNTTPDGQPWVEDLTSIFWNGEKWVGNDIPDFGATKAPGDPGGTDAFIMRPEGLGCLYSACNEGPLPEHYEPWESPIQNPLNSQPFNPAIIVWEEDKRGTKEQYPIIGTTYRISEHWQSGIMTRMQPWLAELVPNVFVELSEELAKEKGIKNGRDVIISTTRGDMKALACVTKRFKPMNINGKHVHEVGVLWHFGFNGYATGDTANWLTPHIGDANTTIPEYKAWLCDIRRA
ncbi:MAG TPA: formate dehydrogenase-N subunit alpha [Syntrophomonadaceae bacterium]|nr:formate dehydrogenase-N subunit alpha [Syntrophomonadaceae bacterium]HPR93835.1 formate dehydrogenase-N subunit alpha [Syntrophomonadaceae bacterium]